MRSNTVIKGGSQILGNAKLEDSGVLELHAVISENAIVRGNAIVGRSTISGNAIVEGIAKVKDAIVGGTTHLNIECIGRNGHVMDNTHCSYLRIRGIGYTVHRTWSEAKGYSAQIMHEDGSKVTISQLKELLDLYQEYRFLQLLINNSRRLYSDED